LPRKYHRPPDTTKRRKIRKTISPADDTYVENGDSPEADEGALDAPITAVSVAEPEPEAEDAPQLRGILRRAAARGAVPGAAERHVARDYSYVLGDLIRIGAIATFLIVSLVITAILRN
jgi:hypothetical protein